MKWQALVGGLVVMFGLNKEMAQAQQASDFPNNAKPTNLENTVVEDYKAGEDHVVHYKGFAKDSRGVEHFTQLWEQYRDINGNGKYEAEERVGVRGQQTTTDSDGKKSVYTVDSGFFEAIPKTEYDSDGKENPAYPGKEFVERAYNDMKHKPKGPTN